MSDNDRNQATGFGKTYRNCEPLVVQVNPDARYPEWFDRHIRYYVATAMTCMFPVGTPVRYHYAL